MLMYCEFGKLLSFHNRSSILLFQTFPKCLCTNTQAITSIGFIGLGAMGSRMAKNLLKQFKALYVYDVNKTAVSELEKEGAKSVTQLTDMSNLDCVISMLPSNQAVLDVFQGPKGLISKVRPDTILIDSSTVDPQVPQKLAAEASQRNITFLDAPVSGGVLAAAAGSLLFMVGGNEKGVKRCESVFSAMGKHVVHCGPSGSGQVAKICNNMMLGISMVAASETLNLGVRLGLDPKLLTSIISRSSGRCWSIDSYNPVPGVLPETPSSNEYKGGFKSYLILKDLGLAQDIAERSETPIPFGKNALDIYKTLCDQEKGDLDFSVVYQHIKELKSS